MSVDPMQDTAERLRDVEQSMVRIETKVDLVLDGLRGTQNDHERRIRSLEQAEATRRGAERRTVALATGGGGVLGAAVAAFVQLLGGGG